MIQDSLLARISPADRELFETQGYLQIPGVLSPDQCKGLVDVTWSLLPKSFSRTDPRTWRGRIQDCCTNIPIYQRKGLIRLKAVDGFRSHSDMERAVYNNRSLVGLFQSFLGSELETFRVRGLNPNFPFPKEVSLNQFVGNRLDEAVSGGLWDRITIPTPPQLPIPGHLEAHAVELSSLIYLSDVEEGAGGLGVWPGSHHLFQLAFNSPIDFVPNKLYLRFYALMQRRKPKVLTGRAGDVILFHNRLLHTNTYNRSSEVRHAMVVDALGRGWRERAGSNPAPPEVWTPLASKRNLAATEPARSVIAPMERDLVAGLLAGRPKLSGLIQSISKDPMMAGRNHVSKKIRERREGDVWIVISQGDEHQESYKLDAYGLTRDGRYTVTVDGRPLTRSRCGIVVEQTEPEVGAHTMKLKGKFRTPHYLRVIQTANPFSKSPILLSTVIPAGATDYDCTFEVN